MELPLSQPGLKSGIIYADRDTVLKCLSKKVNAMASKTFPTRTKVTDMIRKTTESARKSMSGLKNCPILANRTVIYIFE